MKHMWKSVKLCVYKIVNDCVVMYVALSLTILLTVTGENFTSSVCVLLCIHISVCLCMLLYLQQTCLLWCKQPWTLHLSICLFLWPALSPAVRPRTILCSALYIKKQQQNTLIEKKAPRTFHPTELCFIMLGNLGQYSHTIWWLI